MKLEYWAGFPGLSYNTLYFSLTAIEARGWTPGGAVAEGEIDVGGSVRRVSGRGPRPPPGALIGCDREGTRKKCASPARMECLEKFRGGSVLTHHQKGRSTLSKTVGTRIFMMDAILCICISLTILLKILLKPQAPF